MDGYLFAGNSGLSNCPFFNWPHTFPSSAIKNKNKSLLRDLRNRLDRPSINVDIDKDRSSRIVIVEEIVMNGLKMPEFPTRGSWLGRL
jgi:hypothetical protein